MERKLIKKLEIRNNLIIKLFKILDIDLKKADDMLGISIAAEKLCHLSTKKRMMAFSPQLRKYYSTGNFEPLHKNAYKKPFYAVNILRRIVKEYGFKLNSVNTSDGYTAQGKKKLKRRYEIGYN